MRPVAELLAEYPGIRERSTVFLQVGGQVARWPLPGWQRRLSPTLAAALARAGVERLEADWLLYSCLGAAEGRPATPATEAQLAAAWLCTKPELAGAARGARRMWQFLSEVPDAWQHVGQLFVAECCAHAPMERKKNLELWLRGDARRGELLKALDERKALGAVAMRFVDSLLPLAPRQELHEVLALAWEGGCEPLVRHLRLALRERYEEIAAREGLGKEDEMLDRASMKFREVEPCQFRDNILNLLDHLERHGVTRPPGEVWERFFSWLATRQDGAYFRACFLATGEALFGGRGALHPMAPAYVPALAALRKSPLFVDLFQGEGPEADALLAELGDCPTGKDDRPLADRVPARARFAAVLTGHRHPGAALARTYVRLASGPDDRVSSGRLAAALSAYLTLDGTEHRRVMARARLLCRADFWKPFSRGLDPATLRRACDALGENLRGRNVEKEGRIVGRFRRKVGGMRFFWNHSPFWC
jgi:hypothetical protein